MQKHVNIVDLVKSFRMSTSIYLKNRRRYSREQATKSLEVFQFIYSFASLLASAARAAVWRARMSHLFSKRILEKGASMVQKFQMFVN